MHFSISRVSLQKNPFCPNKQQELAYCFYQLKNKRKVHSFVLNRKQQEQ